MSDIESLINEFNDMCGDSETEMGNLAQAEFDDLQEVLEICKEVLEAHDRNLHNSLYKLIDKSLRRVIEKASK